jgi:hypothetical protein
VTQPFGKSIEYEALQARLSRIERRLGITSKVATTGITLAAKRFRVAVKVLGKVKAGDSVALDVVWSAPMPSDVYNVDVACSALRGIPSVAVSAQTAEGCTISFTAPSVADDATVIALGISPAA